MTAQPHRTDTKVQLLCSQLRELALQKGPNEKLPTTRELCELFATSRVTLYEALDELVFQNVIYREQSKGIFVSPKIHRKSICILFSSSMFRSAGASPFWGMLWGFFAEEAQQRAKTKNEYCSFHLVTPMTDQEVALPEEVIAMIRSGRIHGVLAVALDDAASEWITNQGIPCVGFAGYAPWMIGLDNVKTAWLAVSSLAEQGCQRIGLWVPAYRHEGVIITEKSYYEEFFSYFLVDRSLPCDPTLIREYPPQTPEGKTLTPQEQGYLLAMEVFGNSTTPRPDGIFISNDLMTDGALAAFQSLGIRVGEDVKIATHGNEGSMMLFSYLKGMTVIEFSPIEIVQAMFAMLDILLEGKTPTDRVTRIAPRIRPSSC